MAKQTLPKKVGAFVPTGREIKFREVAMGQPFLYRNTIWVRHSRHGASELCGSSWNGAACCSFSSDDDGGQIDKEMKNEILYEVEAEFPKDWGFHKKGKATDEEKLRKKHPGLREAFEKYQVLLALLSK